MPTRRQRVRLSWCAKWEGNIENWAKKFIKKNKWRCDPIHEFNDLLQDCYLIFIKISERYPRVVEQAHFMALFKRAVSNQMHDHARYMRRKRLVCTITTADPVDQAVRLPGEVTNSGYLNALLAEAPEELRLALAIIETEPETLCEREGRLRSNLNMKLRRLLGIEDFDFAGAFKALLT